MCNLRKTFDVNFIMYVHVCRHHQFCVNVMSSETSYVTCYRYRNYMCKSGYKDLSLFCCGALDRTFDEFTGIMTFDRFEDLCFNILQVDSGGGRLHLHTEHHVWAYDEPEQPVSARSTQNPIVGTCWNSGVKPVWKYSNTPWALNVFSLVLWEFDSSFAVN